MLNLDKLKYVDYEEFAQNVYNPKWKGWKDVAEVEKTCKPSFMYKGNIIAHSICFLNNYFLEKAVKEALDLDYLGKDHTKWYAYSGTNISDFVDKNGVTYELKQMKNFEGLARIPEEDWHGCDVRLAFFRTSDAVYKYDKDSRSWKFLKFIHYNHINPLKATTDEQAGLK